jgi:hypothetical protein
VKFSEEHPSIQKALIVAAKFGFIRKETFWKYLTKSNVSYKYDLWNRLIKTGYLKEYNRVGVAENYFCLTKAGILKMTEQGLKVVCKTHPLHFEHDEIVMNFTLSAERENLINDNWYTDRMLRHYMAYELNEKIGRPLDKLPDLLFELKIPNINIECALEVERSRKSKVRYDSLVLSYAKDKKIGLVLIAYSDRYVINSIKKSVLNLGYPQELRPIVFCKIKDVLENPSSFEVEVGNNKINFNNYIENIRRLAHQKTENENIKNSVKNSAETDHAA